MSGALAAINSSVLITSTPSVALASNFGLQDSGDHTTFQVSVANAAYRYWDTASTFTFQTSPDGSTSWGSATPVTIQYVGGKITFAAPVSGATPSARVTAGNYYPYTTLALVTEYDFDAEYQLEDATAFTGIGGSRARIYVPTVLKGVAKLKKWWVDELTLSLLSYVTAGTPLVLSLVTPAGNRIEGYIFDSKLSIKAAVEKLVEEDLELQVSGPFYAV